jgi:putative SOS response-associated peptidase YedK
MCGRFALFRWDAAFASLPGFPSGHDPHWNLSPGNQVLLLRKTAEARELLLARWGLTPPWLTDLSRTPAQARAETVEDQPMFREAYRLRRGIMPANGFYEWRGVRKRPYWITSQSRIIHMAALWECYPAYGKDYHSVAVITRPAASMRRPVLLDEQGAAEWLDSQTPLERLKELLSQPGPQLRERALATLVNDPALDAPECLTPA